MCSCTVLFRHSTPLVPPGSQPSLKIALTSGFPDGEIRDLAESGAVPVLLHKPYRRAELARVIRQALGKDDNQ
jgi:hypothetical protein